MLKTPFIFVIILLTAGFSFAQDAQYSQYYNAPLFLNPAFAGTANNTRLICNYRSQWPGLNKPYTTFSVSFDHLIEPANSGVGVIVRRDAQGASRLNATEVGAIYSYLVGINYDWAFIPAVQASWISRSLNYQNLTFGDQINLNNPGDLPASNDVLARDFRINFLDFSAGGVLFSEFFWFGVSLNHLNRPDQSFANDRSDRIPLKSTFNFGYKIYFDAPTGEYREKSLIPTLLYKTQGEFDQLDIGLYGIYDPIMLGVWYRGIPIKKYSREYNNHDAIVLLAGLNLGGLSIAYSYDVTVSTLAGYSKGAHEINLILEWLKPYKVKKRARKIPCPKFYGGRLKN